MNVYDYLKEVSRHKRTQGSLKPASNAIEFHVPEPRGYKD